MKHLENKSVQTILVITLLFLTVATPFILFVNTSSKTDIKKESLPKLNSTNRTLLHYYDFENDIIGQDPTGITLSVIEPVGCSANIEDLGDGQQKHVALYKSGSSGRVILRDNLSYYNKTYDAGELHFKFYHDNSLFGIWFLDSIGILFRIDFWNGVVGQWAISNVITNYTINQWMNITTYYDISNGWMFDLNGVRYGDDYAYTFEHGNANGIERLSWLSAVSGGGDGYFRIDDIMFYEIIIKSSRQPGIPGYNLYLTISLVFVVSIIIVKLRRKK